MWTAKREEAFVEAASVFEEVLAMSPGERAHFVHVLMALLQRVERDLEDATERITGPGKHKNLNPNLFTVKRPEEENDLGSSHGTFLAGAIKKAQMDGNGVLRGRLEKKYMSLRIRSPACFKRGYKNAEMLLDAWTKKQGGAA